MAEGVIEATQTCASCGHAETLGARFCGRCGARLVEQLVGINGAVDEASPLGTTQNCPSCGYQESRSAGFCSECGTSLPGLHVAETPPQPAASTEVASTGVMPPTPAPPAEAEPPEEDDSLGSQSQFEGSAHGGYDSAYALPDGPATITELEDATGVTPPASAPLAEAEPLEIDDSALLAGDPDPATPPEAEGVAGLAPPASSRLVGVDHQGLDDSLSPRPRANGSPSKADDAIGLASRDSLAPEQPDDGAVNSRICPACESRQPQAARFCGECGAPLATEEPRDPSPTQAAEPQSVDSAAATRPAGEREESWSRSDDSPSAPVVTLPPSAANLGDQPLLVEDGRPCPACGSREDVGARFCGACGGPLADEQSDVTAVVPPRAETYSEPNLPPIHRTSVVHPPAPPLSERRRRSRLWLLLVLVIALAAAGAAAAFILARPAHKAATPRTVTVRTPPQTVTQAAASPGTTIAAPSSGAAPSPVSRDLLPSESRTEMTQEIQALLLQYHQDLVANDASSAWQLLSARKQHQELVKDGYAKWVAAQESLAPYLDPSGVQVRILAEDAASGVVTVDVTGMTWSAPGASCKEWSGITWARYENSAWKYDPGYSTTAARKRAWKSRYSELLGAQC